MAGGVDIHHGGDDHQPSQGRTNLVQLLYEYELDINYDIDHSSPSQVPMFAHAGDSDDEDEDRENLVSIENPPKKVTSSFRWERWRRRERKRGRGRR